MPPSVVSDAATKNLKGDDHILLAISAGHTTRVSILQFAAVLSPRNINSYTGPQYADKQGLWEINDGEYSLTANGGEALRNLLAQHPPSHNTSRCRRRL